MNSYHHQLFTNAEHLLSEGDMFFKSETISPKGNKYWIYNYHLSSFTHFMKPGGLEMRGMMFEVSTDGDPIPIRLACLPFGKFFNLGECPLTMNLNLAQVDTIEEKRDGSLISTYIENGELRFKSKGSISSEQAVDSLLWVSEHNPSLLNSLTALTVANVTVNLEWCSPKNMIVVGYSSPSLIVLNARYNETGEFCSREFLESVIDSAHLVQQVTVTDPVDFINSIPEMTGNIEGYVAKIGQLWFKIKTDQYVSLHRLKDTVNNPKHLFHAIMDGLVDDLKSRFPDNPETIQKIEAMERQSHQMFGEINTIINQYYQANKSADRKTYAIGAQHLVYKNLKLLGPAMTLYLSGGQFELTQFMKTKYKELGIREQTNQVE